MSNRICTSNNVIVKGGVPLVDEDIRFVVDNSNVLEKLIPFKEGVRARYGLGLFRVFIDGTYSVKVKYKLEGRICGGGYQTRAIILNTE